MAILSGEIINFFQFLFFFIIFIYLLKKFMRNQKVGREDEIKSNGVSSFHLFATVKHFVHGHYKKMSPLETLRNFQKDKLILTAYFPVRLIVLRDYDTVKEISSSENFADRPIGEVFSRRCAGAARGMLQNNGPSWKEVRSFTVKKLGKLGFGKKGRMASFIEAELLDVLDYIQNLSQKTNNEIPVHDLFANSVINVVWSLAAGEKFSRDDPEYLAVKNNTVTATSLPHGKILGYQCKPLRYIIQMAPALFGFKEIFEASDNLRRFFVSYATRRQKLGMYKTHAEDFIDGFLQEIDKCSEDEELKNTYCIDELAAIILDLFQAGIDTTNNTLEGAMMLMIKNPAVQKKVQEEIDQVAGTNKCPSYYEDKHKMPYTVAAILEIHRMVTIVPVSARTAKNDCEIDGVKVKKGTMAFLQLHGIRMDEKYWGDPDKFRPERFLDSDNKIISSKANRVFAFGGGMRVCPGEAVATATVFAFLTGVLQRFTLTRSQKNERMEMTGSNSITNSVVPFHMSVTLRQ